MRVRIFFIAMMLISITLSVFAETITLQDFLDMVYQNHPFFSREALTAEIEKKQAESLLGAKDWQFSVSPYYSHLGEASAAEYSAQSLDSIGGEAAFGGPIWTTGGTLGFSVVSDYNIRHYGSGTPNSEAFKQSIGLSYTQPLLKNMGGILDRLGYELSAYGINLAEVQSLENEEDFMLDLSTRFLDWVHLSEMVRIFEERLRLAGEQLAQVEARYRSNLVDRVDVLRGEDAVRSAEQGLLQLETKWKARQAELAVLARSEEIYEKSPVFELYVLEELPEMEESVSALIENSRLLGTFQILENQLVHQRAGLLEEKRPELNLIFSGGLAGRDEKFVSSLEITKPDVTVSLEFKAFPGNQGIKAKIEKIDLQVRQLQDEKGGFAISLEASIRNLQIQIVEMEKILELNQAQIRSAQEKTEEELKLYNQGRGQLTFVIQSRDNEQNARLSYADNAALYHNLIFQYHALLDELFPSE